MKHKSNDAFEFVNVNFMSMLLQLRFMIGGIILGTIPIMRAAAINIYIMTFSFFFIIVAKLITVLVLMAKSERSMNTIYNAFFEISSKEAKHFISKIVSFQEQFVLIPKFKMRQSFIRTNSENRDDDSTVLLQEDVNTSVIQSLEGVASGKKTSKSVNMLESSLRPKRDIAVKSKPASKRFTR